MPVRYLARFSPIAAYRDLRLFLSYRQPYELWFGILAILITALVLFAFVKDSHFDRVYKPNIVYVQQWKADRTDAEIVTQQKADQPAIDKRKAEIEARQKDRQAQFKRLDDKLKAYGF